MANALQLRRGTTTQHNTFTGLAGEVTVDTDKDTVVVHDGSTAGGFPLTRASDLTNLDADTLDGKQLATIESEYQAFANTAVANIVDSAPGTLDTLNELAAALGDDPNFATTVTNSIAGKLNTAGGVITGNVSWADNAKAQFGDSQDLQIYHDGSDSYISGDGTVYLTSSTGNETYAKFVKNGESKLYYDNTYRLRTTSDGVYISGVTTAEGKVTVNGPLDIDEVYESAVTTSSTSGSINYGTTTYGILYFTQNQTANRTINLKYVNANLASGQSLTCTALMTQGSTPYYLDTIQVDGTAVTPKWSGGSAPTGGNASGIDVYTFTIIKTANATFTVLASVTQYA